MLFNSAQFLFVFLPLVWLGHALIARRWTSLVTPFLLLASLVFYADWNINYLPLLLASLVGNYGMGCWLGRPGRRRRLWLGLAAFANLALLGYFKYANFAVRALQDATNLELTWTQVILPIGISFYTFQQIAYLVDSYRGQVLERSFIRYALFITFFPQLIAGPIVHHGEMMPQFGKAQTNRLRDVGEGLTLLILGLLKKLVIADNVAVGASVVFGAAANGYQPTLLEGWLAASAYTLQIYFDFSAYSDMAIGIGRMFGIDLPLNFASPYKATSIIEFWRRWHITLSRFLRDYLYIPLGGNRRGNGRQKINLILTMALGGLWHGADWSFLIWGLLHGVYLLINHLWRSTRAHESVSTNLMGRYLSQALTLTCVVVAWVPFRAADLHTTARVWAGMVGYNGLILPKPLTALLPGALTPGPILGFDAGSVMWLCFAWAIALRAPSAYEIMASARLGTSSRGYPEPVEKAAPPALSWRPSLGVAMLMGLACAVILFELNDASEFIYFQF